MGVYIPHIQMPDSCSNCFYCKHCRTLKRWLSQSEVEKYAGERHEKCPLVEVPEPYGGLIDADILKLKRELPWAIETQVSAAYVDSLRQAHSYLTDTETVIEAEVD